MNEQQKPNFFQRHKRAIWITAGVVAASFGAVYISRKINPDSENEESSFSPDTDRVIKATTVSSSIAPDILPIKDSGVNSERESFPVSEHRRSLPEGQHPSPEKQAEAESRGILLFEGQTLVNAYEKCSA